MSTYVRPDASLPAIAEFGGRAAMSPNEIGYGWSTTSQTRPPADRFNTRDFLSSAAIKYLCRLGVAEYSNDEEYQGRGLVIASNGSIYWNLTPCKGVDPVYDGGGNWELTAVRAHDAMNLMGGALGGFLTQAQASALFVDWGTFNSTRDFHWSHITQAEANIDWISNRAYALEGWRNDTQSWMNMRNGNFDELYWWRDTHTNQINDLYGRANNVDAGISAVNGRVNNTDNNVAAVNARIDALPQTTGSLGSNGWTQLPNGLILQWMQGGATAGNGGQITTGLPRSFPQVCLFATVNLRHAGGGNYGAYPSATVINWGPSSVTWWWNRNADQGGFTVVPLIFAIGY